MNRHGKTMLEVMAVIAILATTMLAVGRMTTAMLRAESAQTAAMRQMNAATRLAERFRSDAHAALRVEALPAEAAGGDAPAGLAFTQPGGRTVAYALDARLTRTVREGDRPIAHDAWPFDSSGVRFERSADGRQAALECRLGDGPPPTGGDHVRAPAATAESLRIEAVVGFDHRFEKGTGP